MAGVAPRRSPRAPPRARDTRVAPDTRRGGEQGRRTSPRLFREERRAFFEEVPRATRPLLHLPAHFHSRSSLTSNSRPSWATLTPSFWRSRIRRTASTLNSALTARRARFPLPLLACVIDDLHPERYRVNEVSTTSGQPHTKARGIIHRTRTQRRSIHVSQFRKASASPQLLPSAHAVRLSAGSASKASVHRGESRCPPPGEAPPSRRASPWRSAAA